MTFEHADDFDSSCVDYQKQEGKNDADGDAGSDACRCWVVSADQYVYKRRIEDGAPKAAGE